jgi:hypothetical protein
MSIEALWAVRFGHAGSPNIGLNGGVVVLESGRLFGGDSWFAYVGNYTVLGDQISGTFKAFRHMADANSESAWGTQETEFSVSFGVVVDGGHGSAIGDMTRTNIGTLKLRLVRIAELPG